MDAEEVTRGWPSRGAGAKHIGAAEGGDDGLASAQNARMRTTLRSLVICGVLLLSATAQAGFDEGVAAYERGDLNEALKEWSKVGEREVRPLAEHGDAFAQFLLGSMYSWGGDFPQDSGRAASWWRRAAEQGNAFAQLLLAMAYYRGEGVPQSYAKAVKWCRFAAEQGFDWAIGALGHLHENGVPQDKVQAHKWYNLAAAIRPLGSYERDWAVKARDAIASKMTAAQITEAQDLARVWRPKSWAELDAQKR